MNLEDLKKPLPKIHWRSQSLNKEGNSAMALAYMDARDVMDRLDAVCGPENWQDSYTESNKGRVICTISICIGDQWVSKSDGAGDTAVEGEKGGISDAFKRAAVKWGIGRYLYDLPATWADCESYERNGKRFFKKWTPAGLKKLAAIHPAAPQVEVPPVATELILITDQQRKQLQDAIDAGGHNIVEICQAMKIKSLKAIRAESFDKAMQLILNFKQQQKAA